MKVAMCNIESDRLILEPLTALHAQESFERWTSGLYRFIPTQPPENLDTLKRRYVTLEGRSSSSGKEGWLNWFVRERSTGELVGLIEVTLFEGASAQIAYFVFEVYQRRGFATEACRAVLYSLSKDYGVKEVHSCIDTRNIRSIALVERLNFRLIKTTKDADFFRGESSDEYEFAIDL